jgi:hypothetical protein
LNKNEDKKNTKIMQKKEKHIKKGRKLMKNYYLNDMLNFG